MQPAGNFKNLEKISDHLESSKHLLNEDYNFGYYLAGLIEANVEFLKEGIILTIEDVKLGYWLKKRIGFGKIIKVSENKYIYKLDHPKGLDYVFQLVKNKLITETLLKEFYNILGVKKVEKENSLNSLKTNHFLTGFLETTLKFHISGKDTDFEFLSFTIFSNNFFILDLIKKEFNGQMISNKEYENINPSNIIEIIKYLDKYTLCSTKFVYFIKWRDAYRIFQKGENNTKNGFEKIIKIKNFFN